MTPNSHQANTGDWGAQEMSEKGAVSPMYMAGSSLNPGGAGLNSPHPWGGSRKSFPSNWLWFHWGSDCRPRWPCGQQECDREEREPITLPPSEAPSMRSESEKPPGRQKHNVTCRVGTVRRVEISHAWPQTCWHIQNKFFFLRFHFCILETEWEKEHEQGWGGG